MIELLLIIASLTVLFSWIFGTKKTNADSDEQRICAHCGYDIRASHGRCPECGAQVPPGDDDDAPGICDDMFLATALEPRKPSPSERMVCACDVSSTVEAAFLTQLLENRGIQALREGQPVPTDYQPVAMRLMVWSEDGPAAAALIAEVRRRQALRRQPPADQ